MRERRVGEKKKLTRSERKEIPSPRSRCRCREYPRQPFLNKSGNYPASEKLLCAISSLFSSAYKEGEGNKRKRAIASGSSHWSKLWDLAGPNSEYAISQNADISQTDTS
jgi:hypothetical protein